MLWQGNTTALLAMIALSAFPSYAQTLIHNGILFIGANPCNVKSFSSDVEVKTVSDVHYIFQEFGCHRSILSRTPSCMLYSCLVTGNASSTPSAHARPEERGMVCNKLLFLLTLPERGECSHHFGGVSSISVCVCFFLKYLQNFK